MRPYQHHHVTKPYFSVENGEPIAALCGGNFDGEILCLDQEACASDYGVLGRDVGFQCSVLEPLLRVEQRSCVFVAGPSGSGKTSFCAGLVRKHLVMHPEAKIILFSRTAGENDPAWADLCDKVVQMTLDQEFTKQPFDCTTLEPQSLLIFDDTATILDDKLREAVEKCLADSLEIGRKLQIYVVATSHNLKPNAKRNTQKSVLNESHDVVVFPGHCIQSDLEVLKKSFGMNAAQYRRVQSSDSRWVLVHTRAPRYCLSEREAWMW